MTTFPQEPARAAHEQPRWSLQILPTEVWASLAIVVMWLAVLVDALWGPDIVATSAAPGDSATIPSAVVLSLFAFLGTWVVARYGFRPERRD